MIDSSGPVSTICFLSHGRNEKEVDDPSDQEQPAGQKPENSGERFSEVEAVSADKSEYPEEVADDRGMGWRRQVSVGHDGWLRVRGSSRLHVECCVMNGESNGWSRFNIDFAASR